MKKAIWICLFVMAATVLPQRLAADENYPPDATVIDMVKSPVQVATWSDGYAIKKDGSWHRVDNAQFTMNLSFGQFDPLNGPPVIPEHLQLEENAGDDVYIVQFVTQPIEEYRRDIALLGGEIHKYLPYHSYLVRLNGEARDNVAELPYVRWVGRYEPAYKIGGVIAAGLEAGVEQMPATRVNIMTCAKDGDQKETVARRILELGGGIDTLIQQGYRIEATLTGDQMLQVISMPEVMWMDLWTDVEVDMDIARQIGGADFIETVAGYTGQGVRGEACDSNLFEVHAEFQTIPAIFHGARSGSDDHGTGVYGIVFAEGVNPQARGMMPDAQGIFADFGQIGNRYTHTEELTQSPWECVFQTNSWGNTRTTVYSSISAEFDDILFENDIVITQSQSNAGNRDSRPQAWSKNVVSVGGVHHQGTLTKADDFWQSASIGPSNDGRIKPDLTHFYDGIFTTDDSAGGYRNFGGTSGATPIVGGHFGLLFQMWSEGIFGNTVNPTASVFDNRCHAATARALMINQASAYPFSGAGANLTRVHQGWGLPDLQRLYEDRNNTFVVDESVVLENMDTASFTQVVGSGVPEFRATLVYRDPMGNPSAGTHTINDLSLRVTAPGGTVYWGNNGLLTGNWSTSGGSANTLDVVENVFVQNPTPGVWTVEVIASQINEDAHLETAAVDADFGLVVTGISRVETALADSIDVTSGDLSSGGVSELQSSDNQDASIRRGNSVTSLVVAEVKTTTSFQSLSELTFTVEGSIFARGQATQTTSLYNYDTDEFEVVDVRPAARFNDQTITVTVTGDPSRFVQPGTGCMEAEFRILGQTPRLQFTANIDFVQWEVTN